MKNANDTAPVDDLPEQPSVRDTALACGAALGHFDELRGGTTPGAPQSNPVAMNMIAGSARLTESWSQFFENLPGKGGFDLNRRASSLERQIHDNGVTYNVYADEGGPQRPWSLDLFPLIVDADSWKQIEIGVLQRMQLLERLMVDVYGAQQSLVRGLLPPALVYGHPGYLRAMHGVEPVGGTHLHIAAFDLARGPDGNWWVLGQRCQAPSGLGYLLENRSAISNQFPEAFGAMRVQRLAHSYRALIENLKRLSPAGADSHLALLTPGPYNETYFEHAYLARYLGLSLVEGSDLMVRDERLYLKTLKGLVPVHGLLKRVDDQYLDPLELRADSTLGVPGLLQAIRAGHVLVANAPGSAFLESPALLGFLPALSQHWLGEALRLPAAPTWWCGEGSAVEAALPRLRDCVIKSTYPYSPDHDSFELVLGRDLLPRDLDEWAARIARQGEDHTLQAYLPLSQIPTWQAGSPGRMVARSVTLRVFAIADGARSWRVLPGGLARVASAGADMASMQHGGSSADVWALTRDELDKSALPQAQLTPASLAPHEWLVTRRAAENLFWLGRYTERTENAVRLARLTLDCLNAEEPSSAALLNWLEKMAVANTLVLPGAPSLLQTRRLFERALIASLGSTSEATSVGYYLRALKMAASSLRERLSQEHWRAIVRAEEELFRRCAEIVAAGDFSVSTALQVLNDTGDHLAAITGAQTDRMTHDDGWRLLSIGRHIERLGFLASALGRGFENGSVHTATGFEAMLTLFDSGIMFHAQYQQSRDLTALIDLLVLDRDNPRSLAWVAHTLRARLTSLSGDTPNELSAISSLVPDPSAWGLAQLCESPSVGAAVAGNFLALNDLLLQCTNAAFKVSDQISSTYFTHSGETKHSVGA